MGTAPRSAIPSLTATVLEGEEIPDAQPSGRTPVHLINPHALISIDQLDSLRRGPDPVEFSPALASAYEALAFAYKRRGEIATTLSLTAGEREAFAAALLTVEERAASLTEGFVNAGSPLQSIHFAIRASAWRSVIAKLSSAETAAAPVGDYREGAAQEQGLGPMKARLTREGIPHAIEDIGKMRMVIKVPMPGEEEYLVIERCHKRWHGNLEYPDGWMIFEEIPEDDDFDEVGSRLTMRAAVAIIRSM